VVGGVEVAVAETAHGVERAGGGGAELVGETGVAEAQQRLALLAQGVGKAQAGREVGPREAGVLARVVDGGEKLRGHGVGGGRGGFVLAALAVPAHAGVGRQVAERDGVLGIGVGVVGLYIGRRVAGEDEQRY